MNVLILYCTFWVVATGAIPLDTIEDKDRQQYYLSSVTRTKRGITVSRPGKTSNSKNYESKPNQIQGRFDYHHKPSGSSAFISANNNKRQGSNFNAGLKYNHNDQNWKTDLTGQYGTQFGSQGLQTNQLGSRVNFLHKPSGSTAFLSADKSKGSGLDLNAGAKYNLHDSQNWQADLSGKYGNHFGSHGVQSGQIGSQLDLHHKPSGSTAFVSADNSKSSSVNTGIKYNLHDSQNWKTDVNGQYGNHFGSNSFQSGKVGSRIDFQHKPSGSTAFVSADGSKNSGTDVKAGVKYHLQNSKNWNADLNAQYAKRFGSNDLQSEKIGSRVDFQHKPSGSTAFVTADHSKGSGTDVEAGVKYNIHDGNNWNADFTGQYANHFGTNNHKANQIGGRVDYQHKPSGSTAFVSADHLKNSGTDLNAGLNFNLHESPNSKADLTGHYSKHFGAHDPRPDQIGGRLDWLHKPSGSSAFVSTDHTKGSGTNVNAGAKYNFHDNQNWKTDISADYSKHFGSHTPQLDKIGGRLDVQHKPSGSTVFTSVENSFGSGTIGKAGLKYNLNEGKNWNTNLVGEYSKHFGDTGNSKVGLYVSLEKKI